jgi:hypothetical protein
MMTALMAAADMALSDAGDWLKAIRAGAGGAGAEARRTACA